MPVSMLELISVLLSLLSVYYKAADAESRTGDGIALS
jgi:hypothetical protein